MVSSYGVLTIKRKVFDLWVRSVSETLGAPGTFIFASLFIVIWLATGPLTGFSECWQLVVNAVTTIVTFLLVILIQNTQNRDNKAVHDKLDELIQVIEGADKGLIELEEQH